MLDNILAIAKNLKPSPTAVVNPIDEVSLGGAYEAAKANLIKPILCGNKNDILSLAKKMKIDISEFEILDSDSEEKTLADAVKLCQTGEAKILMKGKIHTDHLMSAVVKRDNQLRTEKQISHVFVLGCPNYHKPLLITDCAINIFPSLEQKHKILDNAVSLAHSLKITTPKIAILSATETPNPKIPSTIDAVELVKTYKSSTGSIIIEGPLALDNAISKEAAIIKGMDSKVAGDVDILLMPNIEAGNIAFKTLVYLAKSEVAGVVLGAKIPIILTSRADNVQARLLSAALACVSLQK